MAEQIKTRPYGEIIDDLFFGKDAAMDKLAKVRHTQYEMRLWAKGISADGKALRYFNKRFLEKDVTLKTATNEQLRAAFRSLNYAVGKETEEGPTGCYRRCVGLVREMNQAIVREKLGDVVRVDDFIDFFTFDHAEPIYEKPSFIETYPAFFDGRHRQEFKETIKYLRKLGYKMGPINIIKMIREVKRDSTKE